MTIYIPISRLEKVRAVLEDYPATQSHKSFQEWSHLMGILHSIVSDLPGVGSLFSHLQAEIAVGKFCLCLNVKTHTELADWGRLIDALAKISTQLLEVPPPPHVDWNT